MERSIATNKFDLTPSRAFYTRMGDHFLGLKSAGERRILQQGVFAGAPGKLGALRFCRRSGRVGR
jgi:hypothetical protein